MASSKMNLKETSNSKDERLVKCDICNKQFAHAKHTIAHRRTHFVPPNRPFHCLKCPATFINKPNWETHQEIHTNEPLWTCDICDACFSSADKATQHKKIHQPNYAQRWFGIHPEVVEPVKCEICGGLFVNKAGLGMHKGIHNSERPYVCQICGASFKNWKRKEGHYNFKHHQAKPFLCTQCNYKYESISFARPFCVDTSEAARESRLI